MNGNMQLEICCGNLASVLAAKAGGARRIELCSGLSEGGVTPSAGLIEAAVASGIPEINVLIRPRSGDFLYSQEEINLMRKDIIHAVKAGATGVVIGALTADGNIDMDACRSLIDAAREAENAEGVTRKINITFHRAFDLSRNHLKSLEDVIELGCDTLLSSGMASSAVKGIPILKALADRAGSRITIMAGAGVNPANAADIIAATGVDAIHSTARKPVASKMKFRRPDVPMGAAGGDEYAPLSTSPDIVASLLKILDRLS